MSMATGFTIVAISGAAGACARYGVALLLAGQSTRFAYGTLAVNLSGALMAGFFATILLFRGTSGSPLYLLLITGFLGSFTTMSAFSLDTLRLVQDGAVSTALVNILANVAGALIAVVIGAWLATYWAGA